MAGRDNEYPTVLEIMGDFLMSMKKTEELQEFLKSQENFLLKDEDDSEEEPQEEETKPTGGYFTEGGQYVPLSDDESEYVIGQTEDDGYYGDGFHISEDGETLEIFYEMGRAGDVNDDWIREARNIKGVNDDQTT